MRVSKPSRHFQFPIFNFQFATALLIAMVAAACATAPAAPRVSPEAVHVIVVGTTDVHGWFNGHSASQQRLGEPVHYGGLALLASYLDALRAESNGRVVVVDSGDLFQGTMESNYFEGEPVIRGYNALGYSAVAVGNHEFDYGPVGPAGVAKNPGDDSLGALKRNVNIANFPFLSANMKEKATGMTPSWAKPSTLIALNGVKIGIIGLSTPDTPNVTMAANVTSLAFGDPVEATIREAASLRRQGADAVIVVAHMGGRCNDMNDVHDVASCVTDQEAMNLINALPPGTIDGYFGGHTHAQMRQIIHGVPVLQALAFSREFSALDLYIDPAAHKVMPAKTVLRPHTMICSMVYAGTDQCDPLQAMPEAKMIQRTFDGALIQPDAKVAAVLQPFLDQVAAKRNEKIGARAAARFTRSNSRESALGDLLSDTLREWANSDAAFVNSGGIRMPLPEGELVYSDIYEVSPFDNYPTVVEMTGQEIIDALNLTTGGDRAVLQVGGLRYTFDFALDADKPVVQRHRVTSVTFADGRPVDPKATYHVAMPDFLAGGGDGLQPVMSHIAKEKIVTDYSHPLRDVWAEMFHKHAQPLEPKLDGRIVALNLPAHSE